MNMFERFAQHETTHPHDDHAIPSSRFPWLRRSCNWLARRVRTLAAHSAAAAAYANLAQLSDAELGRRGLSRDTLARDLNDMARDQASGRDPS